MFNIGLPELLLILVVALLIFGPNRLPELARSLGKGLAEFRRASSDLQSQFLDPAPAPARPAAAKPAPVAGTASEAAPATSVAPPETGTTTPAASEAAEKPSPSPVG